MGASEPTVISKGTHKIILDLKDCFYTISLAPQDSQRFAFSILSVNFRKQKELPCFVGHIRPHSNLPGPVAEGNALADNLTKIVALS